MKPQQTHSKITQNQQKNYKKPKSDNPKPLNLLLSPPHHHNKPSATNNHLKTKIKQQNQSLIHTTETQNQPKTQPHH